MLGSDGGDDQDALEAERQFMNELAYELPEGTVPTVAYNYLDLPGDPGAPGAVEEFNGGTYQTAEELEAAAEALWDEYADAAGYWDFSPAKTGFKDRVKLTHQHGMPIQFVGPGDVDNPEAVIAERLKALDAQGPVVFVGDPAQVGYNPPGLGTWIASAFVDTSAWGAGIPEYLGGATPSGVNLVNRTSLAMPIVPAAQIDELDKASVIRIDPDAWQGGEEQ